MLAELAQKKDAILDLRRQILRGDTSCQPNVQTLRHSDLLAGYCPPLFCYTPPFLDNDVITAMLDPDPDMRPTDLSLKAKLGVFSRFCFVRTKPFEAAVLTTTDAPLLEPLPE
jgi:hypothetical protein